MFEIVIILLLFITVILAQHVTTFVSIVCGTLHAGHSPRLAIQQEDLKRAVHFALYLAIPCAVYLSEPFLADIAANPLVRLYDISFGVVAVLIIMTSKFSRRVEGFRSTPMDFLIIIVAIIVPNLPYEKFREIQLGVIAAKIILLYFSFEVLMAELRHRIGRVALATVVSLVILAVK